MQSISIIIFEKKIHCSVKIPSCFDLMEAVHMHLVHKEHGPTLDKYVYLMEELRACFNPSLLSHWKQEGSKVTFLGSSSVKLVQVAESLARWGKIDFSDTNNIYNNICNVAINMSKKASCLNV